MKYDNTFLMQGSQKLPCFHDWIWIDLRFDYDSKRVLVQFSPPEDETKIVEVVFGNVIAFNMICCDFWGKSPHIDCITVMGELRRDLIKEVFSQKERYDYSASCLKSEDCYIEVAVSGISGDRLLIACEFIICDY